GVDHHIPSLWPVEVVRGPGYTIRTELPGQRMPLRVGVDDVEAGSTCVPGQLREQQSHRAGAIDQVVAGDPEVDLVETMHCAAQRLDQRPVVPWNVFGELESVRGRHRDELGAGPISPADADPVPVLTQVEATGAALAAGPVIERWVNGHEVSGLHVLHVAPDCHHLSAELVTGDDWVARRGEFATDDVDVGSAHATGLDLDHCVVGP